MIADQIQGISRSLIFLGLLLLGPAVASVVATFLSEFLFDGVVAMEPGGDMPTDDASW